jgi:hypothetical protein
VETVDPDILRLMDKVIECHEAEALTTLLLLYESRGMTFVMALILLGTENIIGGAPRPEFAEYFRTKVLESLSKDLTTRKDALAEFQSNRGLSSEAYVNRRYPGNSVLYDNEQRARKIRQVEHRKMLAELIRNDIDFTIEREE